MSSSTQVGDPPISTPPAFERPFLLPPEFSRPVGIVGVVSDRVKLDGEQFTVSTADLIADAERYPTSTYVGPASDPFERLPALAARLGVEPTTNIGGVRLRTKSGRTFDLMELVAAGLDRLDEAGDDLRDRFAMQALSTAIQWTCVNSTDNDIAVRAYAIADAMMAARKGGRS